MTGARLIPAQHGGPTLPAGIDVRFFCGKPDPSELPEACKNAAAVRAQIEKYGLAEITDAIVPYGTIIAGEWKDDAPWRNNCHAVIPARR